MGQGYDIGAIGALHRRDDPLRGSLLDRMYRIAGGRLKHLCEQAVGITRKYIAERSRRRLGRVEFADRQTHEWSAELDRNSRIGGQVAKTHDPADRALAADQNGLDIATVFVGDEI